MTLAVVRLGLGDFEVHRDGTPTGYCIANSASSFGGKESGNPAPNFYVIITPTGKLIKIGPLGSAKKFAIQLAMKAG